MLPQLYRRGTIHRWPRVRVEMTGGGRKFGIGSRYTRPLRHTERTRARCEILKTLPEDFEGDSDGK